MGARDLQGRDLTGNSDPFVVYSYSGKPVQSTRVKPRNRNPRWYNETFIVPVDEHMTPPRNTLPSQKDLIKLEVFDHDWITQNDFLGHVEMTRSKLMKLAVVANEQPIRLPLTSKEFHGILTMQYACDTTYLYIRIVSAEDLDKQDLFKYASPYAKVFVGEKNLLGSTPVMHNTIHPQWTTANEFKIKIVDLLEAEEFVEAQIRMHRASTGISSNRRERRFRTTNLSDPLQEHSSLPDFLALIRVEVYDRRSWRGDQLLGKVTVFPDQLRRVLPDLPTQNETQLILRNTPQASPFKQLLSGSFKSSSFKLSSGNLLGKVTTPNSSKRFPSPTKKNGEEAADSGGKKSSRKKSKKKKSKKKSKRRKNRKGGDEEDQLSDESESSSSEESSSSDDDSDESGEEESNSNESEPPRGNNDTTAAAERDDEDVHPPMQGAPIAASLTTSLRNVLRASFRGDPSTGLLKSPSKLLSQRPVVELDWCPQQRYPLMKFSMKSYVAAFGLGSAIKDQGYLIVRLISSNRGKVVTGLDQGVRRMTIGETALIKCRFDAFYGHFTFGPRIPPRSDVILQVRLLEINGYGRLGLPSRIMRRLWRLFYGAIILMIRFVLMRCLGMQAIRGKKGKGEEGGGDGGGAKHRPKAATRRWTRFSFFSLNPNGNAMDDDDESDEDGDMEGSYYDDEDDDEDYEDGHDPYRFGYGDGSNAPGGRVPLTPGEPDPFVKKHLNKAVVTGSKLMFDPSKTAAAVRSSGPAKNYAEDELTQQLRRLQELQQEERKEVMRGDGIVVEDHGGDEQGEEEEEEEEEEDRLEANREDNEEEEEEEEEDAEGSDEEEEEEGEEDG